MEVTSMGLVTFLTMVALAAAGSGPGDRGVQQSGLTVSRLSMQGVRLPRDSGIPSEMLSVIQDETAWKTFWTMIQSKQTPAPPAPAVDFSRDMIVVAAAGMKPSTGYAMQVISASEAKGEIVVTVEATSPGAGCLNAMMMTSPVDIARIPKRDGKVRFDVKRVVRDCK
jgi:hypothetical protein